MEARFNFIEINYHSHQEISDPRVVIQKHLPSNLFAHPLLRYANITLVKHLDHEEAFSENDLHYYFFRRSNRFFQTPTRTHRTITDLKPDLVLVQGFIFPWQVRSLRKAVGKNPVILLQHHGESPAGKKLYFQRWADRFVNGYVFSAPGNSDEWMSSGVIKDKSKCYALPSSSTSFKPLNKQNCREQLGLAPGIHFLWVGRLNANKDPLTVLKAFEKYVHSHPGAFLWMIYNENSLEKEIRSFITANNIMEEKVTLKGALSNHELQSWYSATDYYISASWKEGGSYALTEAMACGCIPIVSDIPPAMQAIDHGNAGFYFEKGNSESLFNVLSTLDHSKREEMSLKVIDRFTTHFSAEAVAEKLVSIYRKIIKKVP